MRAALRHMHRSLDRPLSIRARLLLLAGVVILAVGAWLPVWRIELVAPQYPEGLSLEMHTYKIAAGNNGNDLQEINLLNHYIGMKPIAPADFVEMRWIPFAIGAFVLFGLRAAVIGRIINLVDLLVMFLYFTLFSLATFAYRLYTYGHDLDPKAPMRIEPFMPVLVGNQQIANFMQSSWPLSGSFLMALFVPAVLGAIWLSRKEAL
jgi:hypothetical protein